jgi:hypothetical protein
MQCHGVAKRTLDGPSTLWLLLGNMDTGSRRTSSLHPLSSQFLLENLYLFYVVTLFFAITPCSWQTIWLDSFMISFFHPRPRKYPRPRSIQNPCFAFSYRSRHVPSILVLIMISTRISLLFLQIKSSRFNRTFYRDPHTISTRQSQSSLRPFHFTKALLNISLRSPHNLN